MDCGHSNEAEWPNNTLLTYTLPPDNLRESVGIPFQRRILREIRCDHPFRPGHFTMHNGKIMLFGRLPLRLQLLLDLMRAGKHQDAGCIPIKPVNDTNPLRQFRVAFTVTVQVAARFGAAT